MKLFPKDPTPHPLRKYRLLFRQEWYLKESFVLKAIEGVKSPHNDSYILKRDVLALFKGGDSNVEEGK